MMDAIDVLARIPFHEASKVGKEYQDGHYQPVTNISASGKKETLFFNRYGKRTARLFCVL
ncbi:MAG: hypothetical protein KGJ87_08610 [Planctomycetota bacterium]|nr:hypothetical protein [Planctomycetota bacterium]MDE1890329.1 hypothetical protein [Planctomycetota bacterium]MDE2217202.1 hypothetical protein [Planctomycetota bacterium]